MAYQPDPPAIVERQKTDPGRSNVKSSAAAYPPRGNNGPKAPSTPNKTPKELVFAAKVEKLYFSLGRDGALVEYAVEALKAEPAKPFLFGGFAPIKLYVRGSRLLADVTVTGQSDGSPIEIKENELTIRRPGWDKNSDESALEIVNEKQKPVFQMVFVSSSRILINGLLVFPGGVIIGDDLGTRLVSHGSFATQPHTIFLDRIFRYPSVQHPGQRE